MSKRCKDCKWSNNKVGYPFTGEPVWKCTKRQKPNYPDWRTYYSLQREWDGFGFDCDIYRPKWYIKLMFWRAK